MLRLRYLLYLFVLSFSIAVFPQDNAGSVTHTVERGETLYSISKMYDVSESDIMKLNGRTDKKIYAGETLLIPNSGLFHTIAAGETLYQLSKKYGVTVEDICRKNPGLGVNNFKAGQVIIIPLADSSTANGVGAESTIHKDSTKSDEVNRKADKKSKSVDIVLAMPMTKEGGEKKRLTEFYEGMLIGIYDNKQRGISINLNVYDLNEISVGTMLSKDAVANADLIIGPFNPDDIHKISDFAKKESVPFLVPFTSDVDDVFNNPFLFQVNTPQSYLYSDVYANFIEKFGDSKVIIVNDESKHDKKSFIEGFQHELARSGVECVTVSKGNLSSVKTLLSDVKSNVIVPNTGDHTSLSEILPTLQNIVREDETIQLHLFGYPEWQTYTHDYLSAFYELDAYFFTSFYANMLSKESTLFANKYQSWYKKELMNTYPKYGMLGYDLVSYFIPYIWKYGDKFYEHLNTLPFTPVQTGFKFVRVNNWGGFLNRKVFFVHFSKEFGLNILDFE